MSLMRSSRLVPLLALILLGCADATAPSSTSHDLLFAVGGWGNPVAIVDAAVGRVVAEPRPLPYYNTFGGLPVAMTRDSATLLFPASDPGFAIFAVNRWGTSLERRLVIVNTAGASQQHDGLWIDPRAMTVGPDGRHLFIGPAYPVGSAKRPPAGNGRIAVLDLRTMHASATFGPFDLLWQMRVLPPGPVAPQGALLVIGVRDVPGPSGLFVIDPATRAVLDSAVIVNPATSEPAELRSMIPAPDGHHVYLQDAFGQLYDYDLASQQVVARAQLTTDGTGVALAPDGSRLYAIEGGAPGTITPGPDSIQVLNAQLEPEPSIALADQPALMGTPGYPQSLAVSRDGRSLYLGLGGVRAAMSVAVLDRMTGRATRVIPLGMPGPLSLYVGH